MTLLTRPTRVARLATVLAAALVPLSAPSARADDTAKVDNPLYAGWAKWKVGSTASYTVEATMADGKKMNAVITTRLAELTADGATLVTTMSGKTAERKRTIPAKVDPAAVERAADKRDVTFMGQALPCDVVTAKSTADGDPGSEKMTYSLSSDVVGGVVAMDVVERDGTKVKLTLTATTAK